MRFWKKEPRNSEKRLSHPNDNLYVILSQGFPSDREQVAIHTPGKDYSWADIENLSAQYAHALTSLNLNEGARVAVQVEKSPEALMLYLACLRAGYVYLPLNTAYQRNEVAYFLGDAAPELLVCDPAFLSSLKEVAAECDTQHVLTLDAQGQGTLAELAAGHSSKFNTVARQADALAAIVYTSGTTGRSKGAMLSHGNLASNARVLHEYWGWSSDDVLLHMLPIFHVHGLFVASHGALLAGAKMIWLPKLDIDQALHYLPQSTLMMGVPTYYVRLLAHEGFTREVCRSMRLFISGSAPLLEETFKAFEERIGQKILERYGMSETVMLTSNPYDPELGPRVAGTVGRPLPEVQLRIVDDNENLVSGDTVGHVQVQGPNVFSGYWQMPEKTAEEFTQDHWFRTGDMGQWTEVEGGHQYLSIVGRNSDMVITGGYNVYPKEIELLIDEFAGVNESAVVGIPDSDFGEAVVAAVVPVPGKEVDIDALNAHLRSELANYKVPKQIHIIDELPRNTMAKVQKNVLRQQFSK